MTLVEYLKNKFGYNEPIYTDEIRFKNYSRPWIFNELKNLVTLEQIRSRRDFNRYIVDYTKTAYRLLFRERQREFTRIVERDYKREFL